MTKQTKKEKLVIGDVEIPDGQDTKALMTAISAGMTRQLIDLDGKVADLDVTDEKGLEYAAETISIAQKLGKLLEEKRLEITRPILEEKQRVDAAFKEFTDRLAGIRKLVIGKVDDYKAEQRRKAEEERRRMEEEQERQRIAALLEADKATEELGLDIPDDLLVPAPPAPVVAPPPARVQTASGGIGERTVWKWRCIQKPLVPEDLKVLDTVEINRRIRQGVREIPGLEIYQETQTVAI